MSLSQTLSESTWLAGGAPSGRTRTAFAAPRSASERDPRAPKTPKAQPPLGELDRFDFRQDGGEDRTLRKPRYRSCAGAELGVEARAGPEGLWLPSVLRSAKLMQHRVASIPSALGLLRRRQLVGLAQQATGAALLGSPSLVIRHTSP
jgi:hypothetical protein